MTSQYLTHPLRTQETVLHTRRRAVELTREKGMDWERMTQAQRLVMIERAEREMQRHAKNLKRHSSRGQSCVVC